MNFAVTYARVSSKEQEEGFSIPAQQKLIREYASKNAFKILREFVDVETAKQAGRTKFGEMVNFLKTNPSCRVVICEKTDRLYRNLADYVKMEDLDVAIHLAKENQVISKDAKSQTKFMHGIQVLMARNYIDNLREESGKGMQEKAEQGIYPSRPPLGYVNNLAEHTIEIHRENSVIVKRMFELYATGEYSLAAIRKTIQAEFGKRFQKGYIHKLLRNQFYKGLFDWRGITYRGTQERFVSDSLFEDVQSVLQGHNRPKYRKHQFAFSGILTCAHDNCTVTAEIKKQRYVYYRCTGYRGKCGFPYVREEELGQRLGELLSDIHIPDAILYQLQKALTTHSEQASAGREAEIRRYEQRLTAIRERMDQAYTDKLDGRITQEFWQRKQSDWTQEEQLVCMALDGLKNGDFRQHALTVSRILELANKACLLYKTRNAAEQGKLLRMVVSNCSTDGVNLYPTYRKPFDVIARRAKRKEWRARRDSNSRPNAPEAFALSS